MPRLYLNWARSFLGARKFAGSDPRETLRREAKAAGATLAHDGEGGLDPKLALAVFRRDKYECSVPDCKTPKEKLDLDHVAGHAEELALDPEADPALKAEAQKPKADTMEGLHVLCLRHHDEVHSRERAIEQGEDISEELSA